MKKEEPELAIIGCLPTAEMPTAPSDYDNPCKGNCEQCKREVWLSDKKKAVRSVMPNSVYLCMYCVVEGITNNKNLEEIKLFNIGEGDSRTAEEKKQPLPWNKDKGSDLEM